MTTVEELLKKATEKYPTTIVEKPLALSVDIGNLCGFDPNPIDIKEYRSFPSAFLDSLARDDVQLLINEIWKIPTERDEDGTVLAKLPEGTTIIPRFQPPPKPKPLTKWQQYAKDKGIQKRKKAKLQWDEELKKWIPRFGYKKVAAEKEKNWVMEVPATADPMEDQFAKAKEAKKERIAKNELQRLRNIARANKIQVPSVGLAPVADPSDNKSKPDLPTLKKAIPLVRKATASVGHFTKELPKENKRKGGPGKKRKFEPLFSNADAAKQRNLDILQKMNQKAPPINVDQAINQEKTIEHQQNTAQNLEGRKGKKKSKAKNAGGLSKKAAKRLKMPHAGGKKGKHGRGKGKKR